MRITIIAVLLALSFCFALDHTSLTFTPASGQAITASGNKANFDSLRNGINQVKDTVVRDHDSLKTRSAIIQKGQFDTLLAKPTYLKGRMVGDTIAATFGSATNGNFTNLTYDSAGGRVIKASGPITSDSCYARSKRAVKERLDSTLTADSVNARAIGGGFTTAFACSLFEGTTYRATVTANYQKIGHIAAIRIDGLVGSLTGGGFVYLRNFPSVIKSGVIGASDVVVPVYNNNVLVPGYLVFNSGNPELHVFGANWLSGTGGIEFCYFSILLGN